jgi:uncharacterized protein (DUF433 family)/DNA-binding transcriptional MerR regulator
VATSAKRHSVSVPDLDRPMRYGSPDLGVAMSYRAELAAALSGATVGQLAYWRSERTPEPLLVPHHRDGNRVLYSFQDVLGLRTFVYLRSRKISLQKVRLAVANLRRLGATEHLSSYVLVPIGKDVVWRVSDQEAHDLTGFGKSHPVIAQMVDVLAQFINQNDRIVLPLDQPTPGVRVDPAIRGGYPVIDGTRVPYDAVASLVADGVPPAHIAEYYPTVDAASALGAVAFASYVAGDLRLGLSA